MLALRCAAPQPVISADVPVTIAPLPEPTGTAWNDRMPVAPIDGVVTAAAVFDPPPLAAHACASSAPFTANGIAVDWLVTAGPRSTAPAYGALIWNARPSAADAVVIKVCNVSDAPVDAPPATWSVVGVHF
jgi:hypothetical protein